jgi:hypothetical protein
MNVNSEKIILIDKRVGENTTGITPNSKVNGKSPFPL